MQSRVYNVGNRKRKQKWNTEGKAKIGSKTKTAKYQKTVIWWNKQIGEYSFHSGEKKKRNVVYLLT